MSKQMHQKRAKTKRKNSVRRKRIPVMPEEQSVAQVNAENRLGATSASKTAIPGNANLPLIHRQTLVAEMGEQNGNRHLQRVLYATMSDPDKKLALMSASLDKPQDGGGHSQPIQRDLGDHPLRLREPGRLSIGEAKAPSLDVGELQLDPSLLEGLPIQSAFPVNLALRPSTAMLYELVNKWAEEYRLLHPEPPSAQNVWQQIVMAWRELAQQALTSNPTLFTDPAVAQRELEEQAFERISRILAGQPAEESTSTSAVLGEIASSVGEALATAFQKTDFFARLKANALEFGEENWPALIPLLTGSLSTIIGQAVGQGDWRNVSLVTNKLLPKLSELLNLNINLPDGWVLGFQLQDSAPILGATESDVVIGLNPALTLKYKDVKFVGSANLRIETGQDGVNGVRLNAVPGVAVTFPW